MRFLDANVIVNACVEQDAGLHERALRLMERIRENREPVTTTEIVLAEVAVTLRTARAGRLPREAIAALLLAVIEIPSLEVANKDHWPEILDLYSLETIDLTDAQLLIMMRRAGVHEIYSSDSDFDRFSDIQRMEP